LNIYFLFIFQHRFLKENNRESGSFFVFNCWIYLPDNATALSDFN